MALSSARRLLFCLLTCLGSACAHADIYKSVDSDGNVTYSNLPGRHARRLDVGLAPSVAGPAARPAAAPAPRAAPSGYPSVAPGEQKKRDETRRQILEGELAAEEDQLKAARQALADGEATRLGSERNYQKYLDRVQALKDNVTAHEKNVAAIRKELSAVR